MKFIEKYQELRALFNLDQDEMLVPGSTTTIRILEFQSMADLPPSFAGQGTDSHIYENIRFRYPVIIPAGKTRNDEAIVFLHGLNERTWHKHLAGAIYLAEKTGKTVILFPLSYHINRGLPEWTDHRKMAGMLEIRKRNYPNVKEASLVNLALSDRLTEFPQRFFISGLQSSMDLISLLKQINSGDHPFFKAEAKTDLFAYSISCMMLQSLMISNPGSILSRSKIVFFAGGSLFGQMQGVSKYIMDSIAFESIKRFYMGMVTKRSGFLKEFQPWMMEHNFGKAFSSLISPGYFKSEREKKMAAFYENLMVIALHDDKIMPVEGIRQSTGEKFARSKRFKIVHFPYFYIHENPFPVLYKKIDEQVEQAFHTVFDPAVHFYSV